MSGAQNTTEDTKVMGAGILPASHWQSLPVDNPDDDDKSLRSQSMVSSTTSLRESILQYRKLFGRTYHHEYGDAESWIPNDEKHRECMELGHYIVLLLQDNKLFYSPLDTDKIKRVVDIGTGTGIWAMDFADQYPHVEVTGTDITPIQPTWTPPNLTFELDDANQEWTWPDNTFDFVYVRFLNGCIRDWEKFYRQAYRCLKPGGWLEHHEVALEWKSDTQEIPPHSPIGQLIQLFTSAGEKIGRTFRTVDDCLQKPAMEAAGFVDLQEKYLKCPLGDWPTDPQQKQVGLLMNEALLGDLEGYTIYVYTAIMGWKEEEARAMIAHLRAHFRKPGLNPYIPRRVVWGRKPEV